MNRHVVYLMTGKAHVPYLLVCLWSLRKHYQGPVTIYSTERDTSELCGRIAVDLGADVVEVGKLKVAKASNTQFASKVSMFADGSQLPSGAVAYLDADLIVRGPIDELFDRIGGDVALCATQFCDWTTGGGIIRNRIAKWTSHDVDHARVEAAILANAPSPNGGVLCGIPGHPLFAEWLDWTLRGIQEFIADEAAMNILLPRWLADGVCSIIQGGSFNCSPKHKPQSLAWDDVVILHGHGNSFARVEKRGVDLWLPVFQECWSQDIGGVKSWDEWHCGNKWLAKLPAASAFAEYA